MTQLRPVDVSGMTSAMERYFNPNNFIRRILYGITFENCNANGMEGNNGKCNLKPTHAEGIRVYRYTRVRDALGCSGKYPRHRTVRVPS